MHAAIATVLLCSLGVTGLCHADETRDAKGLEVTGAVATTVGVAALIAGAVFTGLASSLPTAQACGGACTDSSLVDGVAGPSLIAAGLLHLAVGIPMLAVGTGRARKLERRDVTIWGAVAPRRDGVTAALSLAW